MMKYYTLLLSTLILLACCSCAGSEPQIEPSPTNLQATLPSPVSTEQPSEVLPSSSPEFDLEAFFGKDPIEALGQLRPVLESVAKASSTYKESFNSKPSDALAWNAVYLLLNYYSADFKDVVKQLEDGTLELSGENMHLVFQSCFAYPYEKLPPVGPDYENNILSYDTAKDVYHVGRADSDTDAFRFENATLAQDGKSAVVEVVVLLGDSSDDTPYTEAGRTEIEITPDKGAKYLYTVKSVKVAPAEQSAAQTEQPSSAEE